MRDATGLNILVVYCHPVATSFSATLHSVVLECLRAARHEVIDLDLYGEGFDPALSQQERLGYYDTRSNIASVQKYVDQLLGSEAIVLVYPSWWYGMPAMLKGYFDRVWLPGVAFDVTPGVGVITHRLSQIRWIVVTTTYGSPWWIIRFFMGDPARKFVSRGLRRLCGRGCLVDWYIKYDMDRATPNQLSRFLDKIRKGLSKL